MMKILFATDLDGTMIYSREKKYPDDICVEIYKEAEYSFMPKCVYTKINELSEKIDILPVTTRSIDQYRRLMLPECINHALVTNGTIVLTKSKTILTESARNNMNTFLPKLKEVLNTYSNRKHMLSSRLIDDMYLCFTYDDKHNAEIFYKEQLTKYNDLITTISGRKVYISPPWATKARIANLRQQYDYIIVAGDSILDIPMLKQADFAIVPSTEMADNLTKSINHDTWYSNSKSKLIREPYVYESHTCMNTFPEFIIASIERILKSEHIR